MKRALLTVLALVISAAFAMGVFAQATTGPRLDTAPSMAPTLSAEKKAEQKRAPMAPKGGVKEESTPANK